MFNGKRVLYQGEVVGDIMVRGRYAWINVSDGVNATGIWIPKERVQIIGLKGDYEHHGDTVKIEGCLIEPAPSMGKIWISMSHLSRK